jgi:hypothetical protein
VSTKPGAGQTFSIFVAAPANGKSFTCGFVMEVDWKIKAAPVVGVIAQGAGQSIPSGRQWRSAHWTFSDCHCTFDRNQTSPDGTKQIILYNSLRGKPLSGDCIL